MFETHHCKRMSDFDRGRIVLAYCQPFFFKDWVCDKNIIFQSILDYSNTIPKWHMMSAAKQMLMSGINRNVILFIENYCIYTGCENQCERWIVYLDLVASCLKGQPHPIVSRIFSEVSMPFLLFFHSQEEDLLWEAYIYPNKGMYNEEVSNDCHSLCCCKDISFSN